jgi:hypothetical protein
MRLDRRPGHRRELPGTLDEASREAQRLLDAHPELVIVEEYSATATPCERCREHGHFRPASPDTIAGILGYC